MTLHILCCPWTWVFSPERNPRVAPRPRGNPTQCESFTQGRDDFSLGGHRLPSLYRTFDSSG